MIHRRGYTDSGRLQMGVALLAVMVLGVLGCNSCKSSTEKGDTKNDQIKERLKQVLANKGPGNTGGRSRMPPMSMKQPFTDPLKALLKSSSAAKRAKAIKNIEAGPAAFRVPLLGLQVVAVGLSPDKWTQNGEPAGIIIHNTGTKAVSHTMEISCGAPPKKFPITVTIDSGDHKQTAVIKEIGNKSVKLPPVQPGKKALFIITADKTWTPGTQDRRKLGVRVMFSIRELLVSLFKTGDTAAKKKLQEMIINNQISDNVTMLGANTLAVGLAGDFFTSEVPAGIVVHNEGKEAKRTELTISCTAPAGKLPITATIHGPKGKQRFVFKKAQQQLAVLPAVAAGESELFFVTTNKTWTPTHDKERKLGVRITHSLDFILRSLLKTPNAGRRAKLTSDVLEDVIEKTHLLGDTVVSVGLSGDRWTVAGEPAGIAVRNDYSMPMQMQLFVSCGAKAKDLPITAIIDDGTTKNRVVFQNPGAKLVDLSPIPSGSKRLYIITTDKTWTPATHDKRWLGVNVGFSLDPLLKAMEENQVSTKDLERLGKALLGGDPIGKLDLVNDLVTSVGLTQDRWTENKKPAVISFRNVTGKAWTPKVVLMTSNRLSDLPVKVFIWDGQNKRTITLEKNPMAEVKLSPVPANTTRSYIFSTDKTFKHKLDQRLLGVQVGVPRDSRPVGFVDDPQPGEGKPTAPATSAAKEETKTLKGPPTEAAPGKALGAPKDEPKPAPKAAPKK